MSPEQRRAANEALAAVKAMQSAASVGVTYGEYKRHLANAKMKVDRVSETITDPDIRFAVARAMDYYEGTGSVWNAKIQRSDMLAYLRIFAGSCQAVADLVNGAESPSCLRWGSAPPPTDHACYKPEAAGIETMMTCAGEHVASASHLIDPEATPPGGS